MNRGKGERKRVTDRQIDKEEEIEKERKILNIKQNKDTMKQI